MGKDVKKLIVAIAAALAALGFKKFKEAGEQYYVKKDVKATGTKWLVIDTLSGVIVSTRDSRESAKNYARMLNAHLTPLYEKYYD